LINKGHSDCQQITAVRHAEHRHRTRPLGNDARAVGGTAYLPYGGFGIQVMRKRELQQSGSSLRTTICRCAHGCIADHVDPDRHDWTPPDFRLNEPLS
jgi:hypothetical protein